MELYLEQGEALSPQQLHEPFEAALRDDHLVPVCFVSASSGAGLDLLLRIFSELMPNPTEGNPPQFLRGEGDDAEPITLNPDASAHAIAHVFKISIDPFVGRLAAFRIYQGTVSRDSQLYIGDARKPFRVGHLLSLHGKEHREIPRGIPGDICAVAKIDDIHFNAVLHDSHEADHMHLRPLELPPPMYGLAIEAKRRGDEQKISDALHKMAAEDPSLTIEHHARLNETVLRGQGELHLRVVLEKLRSRYNIEVDTRPPKIAYRETITAAAEGHHRHKKQTGGAGQFGEVYLRIEPLPRGGGFEFVDAVVGGAIPRQFLPAVEKGVRQVMEEGAIAGYPLQDIRVTVYDGKHHPVDSKEVAFVAAGRKAFLDAIHKARPTVLEPMVEIQIDVPNEAVGDITSDLSAKRGRINETQPKIDGATGIAAIVPLSELGNYASELKAMTAGRGSYSVSFSHYDPVPSRTQQELIRAYRPQEVEN
jgi:elongation factor G